MKFRKKSVYERLNDPESDSDYDGSTNDNDEGEKSKQEYTAADIKYELIDRNNEEKEMPTTRPIKGYYYLFFTVFMIIALMIAVANDLRDHDSYIEKRNK